MNIICFRKRHSLGLIRTAVKKTTSDSKDQVNWYMSVIKFLSVLNLVFSYDVTFGLDYFLSPGCSWAKSWKYSRF